MKETLKLVASILAALIALILLSWALGFNSLLYMKVFGPAKEEIRRETFEQTKSYRDGAIQELRSMQYAYIQADPAHKVGLARIIRIKADTVPQDALPQDLKDFLKEIQ